MTRCEKASSKRGRMQQSGRSGAEMHACRMTTTTRAHCKASTVMRTTDWMSDASPQPGISSSASSFLQLDNSEYWGGEEGPRRGEGVGERAGSLRCCFCRRTALAQCYPAYALCNWAFAA